MKGDGEEGYLDDNQSGYVADGLTHDGNPKHNGNHSRVPQLSKHNKGQADGQRPGQDRKNDPTKTNNYNKSPGKGQKLNKECPTGGDVKSGRGASEVKFRESVVKTTMALAYVLSAQILISCCTFTVTLPPNSQKCQYTISG